MTISGNPLFGIIAGILMLSVGGYFIYRDNVLVHWETLTAKIEESFVDQYRSSDGKTLWKPVIKYKYIYSGKEYLASYDGPGSSISDGAYNFVARHPIGSNIEIKINQKDTFESKLRQDPVSENFPGVIFSGFGLIGIFMVYLSRHSKT